MSKKGGGGTQYDPQIASAANSNAATAAAAEQFAENYQTNEITPLLHQMIASSQQTNSQDQQLFGINMQQLQDSIGRYKQYGIPAENKYYDMVSKYSAPEEQEREAQSALGDMKTAEGVQRGNTIRTLGGFGINPTSPAATSAFADQGVQNAAAEAAAMNRARNTARTMGMALTSDAANFGRGGQSSVLNFGNAAQGNTGAGFAAMNSALGTASGASGTALSGYQIASNAYGTNLGVYGGLGQTDMKLQAQADAGFGQFLGGALGMAAKFI